MDNNPIIHGYRRINNITDWSLEKFQTEYNDDSIKKSDIFWYVYGILHSSEYRSKFSDDLKKMLARIPLVTDFWSYSKAGHKLAEVHLNYENAEPYKVEEVQNQSTNEKEFYKVKKIKFGNKNKDKTVIHYNDNISLTNIPIEAYNYDINGRSAIEWVIDQYQEKTDKSSGIINNPNEYSDNPRYIIDLLRRVITVSLETNSIVNNLPDLEVIE